MSWKRTVKSQHIIIKSWWQNTVLVIWPLSRDWRANWFKQCHSMVVPPLENHVTRKQILKKYSEFWSDDNILSKNQRTNILHRKRDGSNHIPNHHSLQDYRWTITIAQATETTKAIEATIVVAHCISSWGTGIMLITGFLRRAVTL